MSDTRRAPEASSADVGPVGSVSRPSFKRTLTFFGFFAITASMVMTSTRRLRRRDSSWCSS